MPYERSGGKQCVVVGCTNSQKKRYDWNNSQCLTHRPMLHKDCPCLEPFKFHCLPTNDEKRRLWIKALNRKDFNPSSKALVCSLHFTDGRPTKENPVPTLNMGYANEATPARRPLVRKCLNYSSERKKPVKSCDEMLVATKLQESPLNFSVLDTNGPSHNNNQCESLCCSLYPKHCRNRPTMVDTSTQTIDIVQLDHSYFYSSSTRSAGTQHTTLEFGFDSITTDSDARFYTGLSLSFLIKFVSALSQFGHKLPYKLGKAEQILSVLVRLRLGLSYQDLGRRFGVSSQLISDIFCSWIDIMTKELAEFVSWASRETIRRNLPQSFRTGFPKTTCIIDCSEIFIQRPFKIKTRAKTWSTYKNSNTAKFLVAISPMGSIMYVSPLYGGRASDVYITKNSGFLDFLLPGDEVMADRGFTISEDLCARRVKLNIPAFMQGRDQLSEQEVIDTRRIASNRIHVERAIMRMKSYRILNSKLSTKSLKKVNKTLFVVAALCNMRDLLIKDDVPED